MKSWVGDAAAAKVGAEGGPCCKSDQFNPHWGGFPRRSITTMSCLDLLQPNLLLSCFLSFFLLISLVFK